MRVVIVGAGIGGLTAAVALERLGHEVVVLERAAELRPVGAGLTIQPNAMSVYRRLGLADAVLEAGCRLLGGQLRRSDGTVLQALSFADLPSPPDEPAVGIHRGDLQSLLLDALGGSVRTGAPVTDVDPEEPAAILQEVAREGGDAVVGADGIHSAVRDALWGPSPPRYSGYTCWRGVCAAPSGLGGFEMWGRGQRFGAVEVGGGRTYWFAVANAPEGGSDGDDPEAELAARFAGWAAPVGDLLARTEPGTLLRNDIVDRPPQAAWGRGGVTLLGDAAHAMTPNLGQGACQAIEDAWVLARELTEGDDVGRALRRYEAARQPRTRWFVEQSQRMGRIAQWSHPLAVWARDRAVALAPAGPARRSMQRAIGHVVA